MKPSERVSEKVHSALRHAIQDGTLRAGSNVTIKGLAAELGVSVTPVREALLPLREAGLVSMDGTRIIIANPSREALRDALNLREALEGMAARLAAASPSSLEMDKMVSEARGTVRAASRGDSEAFRLHDRQFHEAVRDAAHNEILQRYVANACDLAGALRDLYWEGRAYPMSAAEDHIAIANAVDERDGDEAEARMRRHIRAVQRMSSEADDTPALVASEDGVIDG